MARKRSDFGCLFRRRIGDGRAVPLNYRGRTRPNLYARITISGRDVWRVAGRTKEEAVDFLAKVRRDVFEETVLGIRPVRDVRFEDFAAEYLEAAGHVKRASTMRSDRNKVNALLIPEFRGRKMAFITREDVEKFHRKRAAGGVSLATLNRDLSLLSAIFRKAVNLGCARENPVAGLGRPQEARRAVPALSLAEQDRLIAKCPSWLRPLVVVSLDTGLRKGELAALEWGDVDLVEGAVQVRESKTKTPRRVPLTSRARAALEGLAAARVRPLKGPDRVLGSMSVKSGHFVRAFQAAVESAKLPKLRWHDLRHLFAVNQTRAGTTLPVLARLTGHATLSMVWRYACHSAQEPAVGAVARMDALLARRAPPARSRTE